MDSSFQLELDSEDISLWLEQQKPQIVHNVYNNLCLIQYDILNKKIDLDVILKVIQNAKSLKNLYEMPKCILIKMMQIFQLLKQFDNTILDSRIQKFQQFIKQSEDDYKQLNLVQNTETYEIQKAYIFDYREYFKYIALSPNEKYLLVGTSRQVYIYDILTKMNSIIFSDKTIDGIFSSNSKQIILISEPRIIVININNGYKPKYNWTWNNFNQHNDWKKSQYIFNDKFLINVNFINKNWLYLLYFNNNSLRIAKMDFKLNRQIFSLNIPCGSSNYIQFFEDLIITQSDCCLQIFNEKTRKSIVIIELQVTKKLFLINKNEMLYIDEQSKLIILNIDYQNKILVHKRELPFSANQVLGANPSFRYIYLISENQFQIIDENYNSIYKQDKQDYIFFRNLIQLNTDKIFIIFKQDGIYILTRSKMG